MLKMTNHIKLAYRCFYFIIEVPEVGDSMLNLHDFNWNPRQLI
jgi:hypothetical protein